MASAIGTALFSAILQPMAAKAMERVYGIANIEREISSLQTTLRMIERSVQIAEEKLAEEKQTKDDFIRNWLRDLVDIGYEARDVLDDFNTFSSCTITAEEASNPVKFNSSLTILNPLKERFDEMMKNLVNTTSSLVLSSVSCFGVDTPKLPLATLNQLAKDIRSVRERFDEKKKVAEEYKILISVGGGGGSESVDVDRRRKKVGPSINKQRYYKLVEREEVKEGIMEKILHPSDNCVHVVVIWGMGGIGKTTLAQSIYNDEKVKEVSRRWLPVGENNFSAEKVIREILNDKKTIGIGNLDKNLRKEFSGDRFLIVLDDVWDVDGSEWGLLFNPLTEVKKGGLIVITRREKKLCDEITIQTAYNLKPLSEEDSWSLFESYAYKDGKSNSTPDLEDIGKEIVKKLSGLPLALKVVGQSLRNKDYNTWTNFLESKLTKDNEVMYALRWSYNHLPPHLKMCFTYCALFPKDHVLDKKALVQMWMAHDLIQEEEQERPEDVGAYYFEQLVNASLLQCVDGKYRMHDMIHDLALHVSNGEFASTNSSLTNDQMEKVRHITITPRDYSKIPRLCKIEKLLTLVLYSEEDEKCFDDSVLYDVFKQLKSIRVLVLVSSKFPDISDCISKLRHLRYLDLKCRVQCKIPDSLCRLYNLQMLAACQFFSIGKLPRDIVNISSLRYVKAALSTCKGVGKLTSLQKLSSIHVCKGDNIRELGDMQRLRGKLRIEGLENVEKLEDDVGALMEKQTLMDELVLEFHKHLEVPVQQLERLGYPPDPKCSRTYRLRIACALQKSTISEEVLDALGCPPNLKYLEIDGYTGVKSPCWMVDIKDKFAKLQTLKLEHCFKLESLPPLGELTSLKYLSLVDVGFKRLGDEFYGNLTKSKVFFPSLESLHFSEMQEWEEWDDIIIENSSVSFFPCLTTLEINECPKLVSLLPVVKTREEKHPIMNAANFMTSLSRLEIRDCDGLKRLQLDALLSLKELLIRFCKSLVQITSAICLATTIETLEIYECEHLETMDFERLPALKRLDVTCCNKLISNPCLLVIESLNVRACKSLRSLSIDIHGLDFLEHFRIIDCPVLELTFEEGSSSSSSSGNSVAVAHQWLPDTRDICTDNTQVFRTLLHHEFVSLEFLRIEKLVGFENFEETEANNFCKSRSLKSLHILQCKDLKSLPADFHKLSSLQELHIKFCPELQSLPPDFHKLSSLKNLRINDCPQLQSLPANGLPPSLRNLEIKGCPLLYERCKDEFGLDWQKINDIPWKDICP